MSLNSKEKFIKAYNEIIGNKELSREEYKILVNKLCIKLNTKFKGSEFKFRFNKRHAFWKQYRR